MGRFLSVDPMGYKDSMNLYQAFNQNPVNFVDPLGLFIRKKQWIKGYAPIEVESGDTMEELASLLPGVTEKEVRNYIPNIIPGKEINVSPLINIFEEKVRSNIVKYARMAEGFYGLKMPDGKELKVSPAVLSEQDLIDLFNPKIKQKGWRSGCMIAAELIMLRGLLDELDEGELIDLYPVKYIEQKLKVPFDELEKGDLTHIMTKIDKNYQNLDALGISGEWIIMLNSSEYFGFLNEDTYRENQIKSLKRWLRHVTSWYNTYVQEAQKITIKDIVGFYGKVKQFNFYKLAQSIFDYRN
jgi:hypothetical protein